VFVRVVRRGGRRFFALCEGRVQALLLWEVWRVPLPIMLLPKADAGQKCPTSTEQEQRGHLWREQGLVAISGCPNVGRCVRSLVFRQVTVCVGLASLSRHASIAACASASLMGRSAPPLRWVFWLPLQGVNRFSGRSLR